MDMQELIELEKALSAVVDFVPPDESMVTIDVYKAWDGDFNISQAAEACNVLIPDMLDAIREHGVFFEGAPGVFAELNEEARSFTEMGEEMGESRRKRRIDKLCGALVIRKAALVAWARSSAGEAFLAERKEARVAAA